MYVKKSCIYKFEHNNNVYVGSTTNLRERCWTHNQHLKQPMHNHTKFYQYLNENFIIKIEPFVEILGEFNNITKDQLRIIEQVAMDTYKPNLNMYRAVGLRNKKYKNLYINV